MGERLETLRTHADAALCICIVKHDRLDCPMRYFPDFAQAVNLKEIVACVEWMKRKAGHWRACGMSHEGHYDYTGKCDCGRDEALSALREAGPGVWG